MRYVEGVPRSEQILWFIDNYVKEGYKTADRQHVITHKDTINNIDDRSEIGVKYLNGCYDYLLPWEVNDDRLTEVFYPVDNITLGELI
jgi:hypothetical protein